jgi:DNA-directed RNA polymerase specialized sigma24 family protein
MSLATEQIRRYCTQADQPAFQAFYRTQAPKLWKFLVARGCHPDAAYDLLSDAFLRFINRLSRSHS